MTNNVEIIENEEQLIDDSLFDELENEIKKSNEKISLQSFSNIPSSHHEFWNKFLNENFPIGSINKHLEKNLSIFIIKNNIPFDIIKDKYKNQKWNVGPLSGWIKKIKNGDIVNYNTGELVNWCKENNRLDLIQLLKDKEIIIPNNSNDEIKIIWEKDLKNYIEEGSCWLVDDLIPQKSVGVWTGKRGSFKTFLILNMVICCSLGIKFLNNYTTKKIKILYLDKENGVNIIKNRIPLLKKGLNILDENILDIGFICFSQLRIDKESHLLLIEDIIKKNNIELLVIDTYRRAVSFEENNAGEVSKMFVDNLRPLVEKNNLSIILIHHDRKGSKDGLIDEMDEVRGSSDLVNYSDFVLKNERLGNKIILKQLKSRGSKEINPIEINIETEEDNFFKFNLQGEYTSRNKDEKCSEILFLWFTKENLQKFKISDFRKEQEKNHIKKNTLYNSLKNLQERGIIKNTSKGEYEVLETHNKVIKNNNSQKINQKDSLVDH